MSDALQQAVVQHALESAGIGFDPAAANSTIRVKHGVNALGHTITYLLNYSSSTAEVKYSGPTTHDVLTNMPVSPGQMLSIQPWDLVIAEGDTKEDGPSR
jgi:ribosome recycling factor